MYGQTYDNGFYQDNRFGSARWANPIDVARANLYRPEGIQLGYFAGRPFFCPGLSPLVLFSGSGSGKGRDILVYLACLYDKPMMINDPKGELAAISRRYQKELGKSVYLINPVGLHEMEQYRLNPLDIIEIGDMLDSDCRLIAEMLIPLSSGDNDNGKFFDLAGRRWVASLLKWLVLKDGSTSIPDLFNVITMIDADPIGFEQHVVADMMRMKDQFPDIAATGNEIHLKQHEAQREYTAIMATIQNALGCFADPLLQRCLSNPNMSLEALCKENCTIYLNIPSELTEVWSAFVRVIIGVAMLYKQRNPGGQGVYFLIDECAQLGKFEQLLRAYQYGRGMGLRVHAIYQDLSQIKRTMGSGAVQGILGSSQVRQFLSVRDYETAKLVSDMLGTTTLEYDDPLQQQQARYAKERAFMGMWMDGQDPFHAFMEAENFGRQEQHRHRQPRPLMTPAEVMALPDDQQIVFISGVGCPPLLANRYPYWNKLKRTVYDPNPYYTL